MLCIPLARNNYVKILHLLLLSLQLFVNSLTQKGRRSILNQGLSSTADFTAASASVVTPGIPTCTEKREGGGEAGGGWWMWWGRIKNTDAVGEEAIEAQNRFLKRGLTVMNLLERQKWRILIVFSYNDSALVVSPLSRDQTPSDFHSLQTGLH